MRAAGLAQIETAKADGRWEGAYAPASRAEVPIDLQKALDNNPKASAFFATLNSRNRYAILYRIGNVQKTETRARKIAEFVACWSVAKQSTHRTDADFRVPIPTS